LSVVGEPAGGTYTAASGRVDFEPAEGRPYSTTLKCLDDQLSLNHVVKVRADEWLAAALDEEMGVDR
jgi:hypothetical protein